MTKSTPTIGVYITTHNRLDLLKRAIGSVLEQSYPHIKVMIIDDGSSDGTWDYLQSLDDPRIECLRNDVAQGSCNARNLAIEALDTPLVTGLDDDDRFLPHRLETLMSCFDEHYAFACSGYYWDYGARKKALFNKDKVISLSDALDLNECSNQILVKRERILAVGGFDPELPALQDHDLWVRLIAEYGPAYRVGTPSYVVNDDRSFERISSVTNKVTAINLFRQKHEQRMSERNLANFRFYEQKIKRENLSLADLLRMRKHGLTGLKFRYYLSHKLAPLSRFRLALLSGRSTTTGGIKQLWQKVLPPLIATGGPGASRVLLFSASILFFSADLTAPFGGDFFLLMLLNTAFAQSFGFFLLRADYQSHYRNIYRQSLLGLPVAVLICTLLWSLGFIHSLLFSLILLTLLHGYYVVRYRFIAAQRFTPLALAEIVISLTCVLGPWLADLLLKEATAAHLYLIYAGALLFGLSVLMFYHRDLTAPASADKTRAVRPSLSEVRNIAVSTTGGIFAVFILPAAIKQIATAEVVSVVALAVSCISISILLPRTYANTILTKLADPLTQQAQLRQIGARYQTFVLVSVLAAYVATMAYMAAMGIDISQIWWLPLMIALLILVAQSGFVVLTYLSLQKQDAYVARLNLLTLLGNAFYIGVALYVYATTTALMVALGLAVMNFMLRNFFAKRYSTRAMSY